ncbi:MAG: signal recognition particle receptor subunit alpha, partial [Spirochaetota bacterium]
MGLFSKKKNVEHGLHKTKESLGKKILNIFKKDKIDEDFYDDLEETLIDADVGIETTLDIINRLKAEVKEKKLKNHNELIESFKKIIAEAIDNPDVELKEKKLNIIFVVGVNGVGKTTSIAKLANLYQQNGKNVIIAACDTFRAAAVEQLTEWANR